MGSSNDRISEEVIESWTRKQRGKETNLKEKIRSDSHGILISVFLRLLSSASDRKSKNSKKQKCFLNFK